MSNNPEPLKTAATYHCSAARHDVVSGPARVTLGDSGIKRFVLLLTIGSLLLPLGCGDDDPSGPEYATLVISTTSLPSASWAVPYSETLVATGGNGSYTWSVTSGSLPTGLSLTAATGLISGTASVVGSRLFTVQVVSGDAQTDTQRLWMAVEPPVLQPSELCSDYPESAIATFADTVLEAAVRSALSVSEQVALTCRQLSRLTTLGFTAYDRIIWSLAGIQNLTNLTQLGLDGHGFSDISALSELTSLTELNLAGNQIGDISALSGLTNLTRLNLNAVAVSDISALSGLTRLTDLDLTANSISDISALSELTSLRDVNLSGNSISDISALSGLTSLWRLYLFGNSISDISALSGLTSLIFLGLGGNSISDISALSGLTSLARLYLDNNPNLADIQPLLDNTGLGAGDAVYLGSTSVSCADVAALQAKGVTVSSDCP